MPRPLAIAPKAAISALLLYLSLRRVDLNSSDRDHPGFDRRLGRARKRDDPRFSSAGLIESDGLIVSILFGLVTLALGVIGGIVWIASGYSRRSVRRVEAETHARGPSA